MKKLYSCIMLLTMMVAALSLTACGGDDDGDGGYYFKQDYDVLQINGVQYACYGYRCVITYKSTWDSTKHSGEIMLPCGDLADAQKGVHEYKYMYSIGLKGSQDLKTGSKLENFSPIFERIGEWKGLSYISGSASVIDMMNDRYITIKFDSFTFGSGSKSYTLNGTVQLMLGDK